MAAVQLREFTSGAEMMAHYAAIRARRLAVVAPMEQPKPEPKAEPVSQHEPEAAHRPPAPVAEKPKLLLLPPVIDPVELVDDAPRASFKKICAVVAKYYRLRPSDLASVYRTGTLVRARQVTMYLGRKLTCLSWPQIGRLLKRDHSTVIHGAKKIERLRATDGDIRSDILALLSILTPAQPETIADHDPNQLALPLAGEG